MKTTLWNLAFASAAFLAAAFSAEDAVAVSEEFRPFPPPVLETDDEGPGKFPLPPPELSGEEFHRVEKPHEGPAPKPELFLRKLRETNPEEYDRLLKLRVENREEFMKELGKMMPRPKKAFDKKQLERDRQCWNLAREIRQCQDEARKAELMAQLEKLVAEMNDDIIAQAKQRMEEMAKHIQTIQENRESILKKRVNFFLNAPLPPEPEH